MQQPMKILLPKQAIEPAKVELPAGALPMAQPVETSVSPKRSAKLSAKLALPQKVELPAKSIQFEAPAPAEGFFGYGGEEEAGYEQDDMDMSFATKTRSLRVPPGLDPPAGSPSHGSVMHGQGNCRPCAWFWKPGSCQNGKNCLHCHSCPEGELKARKKAKQTMMRLGLATPKLRFEATDASESAAPYSMSYSFFPECPAKKPVLAEHESTTCSGSEPELSFSGSEPDSKGPGKSLGRSPRSSPKQRVGGRRSG